MKDLFKHFGFNDQQDLITSIIGLKSLIFNFFIAFIAAMSTFITGYMYDTPTAIYTLQFLMLVDQITGMAVAIKEKNFESRKVARMILFFLTVSLSIGIAFNLAKANIIFYFLPSLLYGGFASTYFISLLENFAKLGYMPDALYQFIKEKLGLKALFDKDNKIIQQQEINAIESIKTTQNTVYNQTTTVSNTQQTENTENITDL